MVGLLGFAAVTVVPAITIAIPAIVVQIITGASLTVIAATIPLDGVLDLAVVAAIVAGIKEILGCG